MDYPTPWTVMAERYITKKLRRKVLFNVARLTAPNDGQFVLEGYSDVPAVYRRRRDAEEVAAKLNSQGATP